VRDPGRSTVQLSATELCERARIPASVLRQLEEYGLLAGRVLGTETTYDAEALRVAELARRLLELGLEVRHLRTWRMNAEKEVSLFEQLVLPLLRQRNPQARQHATDTLHELAELGAELRGLLVETALRTYLDR
jgi:DNA-binding transcriptional MerR regulator